MRLFLLICAAILSCQDAHAQGIMQDIIHGVVVDGTSGDPLPAATLHEEGTYRGTTTNAEGRFELVLPRLPATLHVRHLGYRTAVLAVERFTGDLIIHLDPALVEMDDLVVTGEDPAVSIMRKVIARKQEMRARLASYRVAAYHRFSTRNDTGIVALGEYLSEVYWDREQGIRERVYGARLTPNMRGGDFAPSQDFFRDLYDDEIEIDDYRLVGPAHPDALRFYDFALAGRRAIDRLVVYDIDVHPKSDLAPAFIGRISVMDEEYVMLAVDLVPGPGFLPSPPAHRFDVRYRQQFSAFGGDVWLPADFRFEAVLGLGLPGVRFPPIHLEQISQLSEYEINVPIPDSMGSSHEVIGPTAGSRASSYEDTTAFTGIVPLTPDEETAYETIDSSFTLTDAFRPRGPLAFLVRDRFSVNESGESDAGSPERSSWFRPSIKPRLRYDRVDGAHVGFDVENAFTSAISVNGFAAYNTASRRWASGAGLRFETGEAGAEASYRFDTVTRSASHVYPRPLPGAFSLFGMDDYFDYYLAEAFALRLRFGGVGGIGTSVAVGLHAENHTSLESTTSFDLVGRTSDQRPNPPIDAGNLRSLSLELTYRGTDDPPLLSAQRRASLALEHSAFGSDFDFTRVSVLLDWRFETFLKRRRLPNALDLRLVASTFRGTLPVQRLGALDARLGFATPFGAFKTLGAPPYEGERYAALFWEHNFRTLPFEAIGWYAPARRGISIILHGAHGRTWIAESRLARLAHQPRYQDRFHHELGFSISGILGIARLDVTHRLDEPGFFVGLSVARML